MMEVTAESDGKQPKQATASGLKEALFRLNSKFELGEMHDATEAHEALLDALHRAIAVEPEAPDPAEGTHGSEAAASDSTVVRSSDSPRNSITAGDGSTRDVSTSNSFVKRIFSMRMRMTYADPTDPTEEPSKPVNFEQWTQYVLASELRGAVREHGQTTEGLRPLLHVLRKEAGADAVDATSTRKITMLRPPHVFTLGLASDTAHASKAEISESLQGIEERLNLRDVYDLPHDVHCELIALTAFYEQHYVCFCFSRAAGQWIHYDDDARRLVGRDFADVKEKCVAGRLHPMALFYETR